MTITVGKLAPTTSSTPTTTTSTTKTTTSPTTSTTTTTTSHGPMSAQRVAVLAGDAPPSTRSRWPQPRRWPRACAPPATRSPRSSRARRRVAARRRAGDGGAGLGPPRHRRRVPGAPRTLRRGRDGSGAARVPRHGLRRRRRAGVGAVHGQSGLQGAHGRAGHPAGGVPRRRRTGYAADPKRSRAVARLGCRCSSSRPASARRSASSRSTEPGELDGCVRTAFAHDSVAIVEAAAAGREVECSVLGNGEPIASEPGRDPARCGRGAVGMTTRPSTPRAG